MRFFRLCAAFALLLAGVLPAQAAEPTCPPGDASFPTFYEDARLFTDALAKVAQAEASNVKLSGITVPHHLLADRLVALGFRSASAFQYKRIVILSPDHFRNTKRLFATTTRGFDTVLGPVPVDVAAARSLLAAGDLLEESCLFGREHGVHAVLPFIRHYFPDASIVPIAMSIKSTRKDWDRLAEALAPILDEDTLVVESTDFSHYLPQHVARIHDQQTLNVLAAGSLDQIAALRQPAHADSVGALYVQVKLQRERFGASPLAIANANSQAWSDKETAETTSYVVALFGRFDAGFESPAGEATSITYLAGDTNFGRFMKMALLEEAARDRVLAAVRTLTRGRPLVVNLEGVILPNVPEAIDDMTLAMPEDLAIPMLNALGVVGVGLANNHALDLGTSGLEETRRALSAAGIPSFAQGETLALPGLDLVGLTDIDTNGSRQTDLITPELLDRLVHQDAARATVGFVHWGREYVATPSPREKALADEIRLRAVPLVVGAHPHVTDGRLTALSGGDTAVLHSLGNFLFDQNSDRASGALIELRVFAQGTVFARVVPLPNLFEVAKGE